ncbi:STAS domain-containing protein [Vibrio tubiashii]|uniref:STAS domain-containing protein n=1 Tax=Vibrio tubiashii TaxID=29498 RepID=UPI001EFE1D3D|nr:STAS domain-containing protein [Vibrio tubiashii]MCG9580435.1 STAS domain-containing protein [Vibrio tubiashii]MCG9614026.1 STAS domain-containing protein [Vibrio tubiashii]MCG9685725.1 STAS domain-containing protein [Vibrio tubiashii]
MKKSISISQLQNVLVATIQVDLSDEVLDDFRLHLLEKVGSHSISGVLIDLSEVKTLDRADFDKLFTIVKTVQVMGRRCLFVGIRPGIAMALVNIGYQTEQLPCVQSIDDGLHLVGGADD